MSDSVLLTIVRDSILEVYQVKRLIDKHSLLQKYPILSTAMNCTVTIYLNNEPRNTFSSCNEKSLLENIILSAKKAAFEDTTHPPLSASKYLHCKISLTLHTNDGDISEIDEPLVKDENALIL